MSRSSCFLIFIQKTIRRSDFAHEYGRKGNNVAMKTQLLRQCAGYRDRGRR